MKLQNFLPLLGSLYLASCFCAVASDDYLAPTEDIKKGKIVARALPDLPNPAWLEGFNALTPPTPQMINDIVPRFVSDTKNINFYTVAFTVNNTEYTFKTKTQLKNLPDTTEVTRTSKSINTNGWIYTYKIQVPLQENVTMLTLITKEVAQLEPLNVTLSEISPDEFPSTPPTSSRSASIHSHPNIAGNAAIDATGSQSPRKTSLLEKLKSFVGRSTSSPPSKTKSAAPSPRGNHSSPEDTMPIDTLASLSSSSDDSLSDVDTASSASTIPTDSVTQLPSGSREKKSRGALDPQALEDFAKQLKDTLQKSQTPGN